VLTEKVSELILKNKRRPTLDIPDEMDDDLNNIDYEDLKSYCLQKNTENNKELYKISSNLINRKKNISFTIILTTFFFGIIFLK